MDRSTAERYQQYVRIAAIVLMSIPVLVASWYHPDGWLLAAACSFSVFYIFGIMAVEDTVVERIWSKVEE